MAKFRVTGPDGRKFDVTVPEGATREDAIDYIADLHYGPGASETWQVPPALQRERDEVALARIEGELAADPTNPNLQRDAANARARLGKSAPRQTPAADDQYLDARDRMARAAPAPAPKAEQAAPKRRTLDEQMKDREAEQRKYDAIAQQVQSLEESMIDPLGNFVPNEGTNAAIANLRAEQARLKARIDKLGVGQAGRIIGSTVGGIAGGIGGGVLGSGVGPAGTVAGGLAGSAAGTGLGSWIGSKIDAALAEDITEAEAAQLIKDRVVEDVVLDAAGGALFLVGGKLLRVTGASKWLLNQLDIAPKGLPADEIASAAKRKLEGPLTVFRGDADRVADLNERAARVLANPDEVARKYVKPGEDGGRVARVLETLVSPTEQDKIASRANYRTTSEKVRDAMGFSKRDEVTEEGLDAIRQRAGRVYEDVKGTPNPIRLDSEYDEAIAKLDKELTRVADEVPALRISQEARDLIDGMKDLRHMSADSMVEAIKVLRADAKANFRASATHPERRTLAMSQRGIAQALEDALTRDAAELRDAVAPHLARGGQDAVGGALGTLDARLAPAIEGAMARDADLISDAMHPRAGTSGRDAIEGLFDSLYGKGAGKRVLAYADAGGSLDDARRVIARVYDVERALAPSGEIRAARLPDSVRYSNAGDKGAELLSEARRFGAENPKLVQLPSRIGETASRGAGLGDWLSAVTGMLLSGHPGGAILAFIGRRNSRDALERIMERAAAQGDREAFRHAARLRAISLSGRKDAAVQVMARESLTAIARMSGAASELSQQLSEFEQPAESQ